MNMPTPISCRFCGKNQNDVGTIIKGVAPAKSPDDATAICDACVALCVSIIAAGDKEWLERTYEEAKTFKKSAEPKEEPQNSN